MRNEDNAPMNPEKLNRERKIARWNYGPGMRLSHEVMDRDPALEAPQGHVRLSLSFLGKPSSPKALRLGKGVRRLQVFDCKAGCISRIELDPRNPYLECLDGKALLRKKGKVLFFSLGTIPEGTRKIESFVFPKGLRKKTLVIPSSVEEIEIGALNGLLVQTLVLKNPDVEMEHGACASPSLREVRIQGKAPCLPGSSFRNSLYEIARPYIRIEAGEEGGEAFFRDGVYANQDRVVLIGNLDEEGRAIIPEWATGLASHSYEGLHPSSIEIPSPVRKIEYLGLSPRKHCPVHIGKGLEEMESTWFLGGTDRKSLSVSPDNKAFLSPEGSGVILRREDLAVVYATHDARIPGLARKIAGGAFLRTPPVLHLPERLESVDGMVVTGIARPGRRLIVSSRNLRCRRNPILPPYRRIVMKRGAHVPLRFFTTAFEDPPELSSIRLEKGYEGHRMAGKHALMDGKGTMLCLGDRTGTIPEGTEAILFGAFSNLDLHGLHVPEGVKEIEDMAFFGSSMGGKVILPASLAWISSSAFHSVRARRSLRLLVSKDNPYFYTDKSGRFLLRKEDDSIVLAVGKIARVPEEAKILKNFWLDSCLPRTLFIPKTVAHIEPLGLQNPFIRTLIVEGGLEKFAEVYFRGLFQPRKIRLLGPAKEIPASLFLGASDVEEIILPEGLERIGERAFLECKDLRKARIPDSVRFIGSGAFGGTALRSVLLPQGCKVAPDAFDERTRICFQEDANSPCPSGK